MERLRTLLSGEPDRSQMLAHLVERRRAATLTEADHGGGALAETNVWRGHDADLRDRIHAHQQLLDLLGADVLAAADDDVRHAIGDREVSLVVEHADIASPVPPFIVENLGGQLGIDVADEAVRPPTQDLPTVLESELDAGPRITIRRETAIPGV